MKLQIELFLVFNILRSIYCQETPREGHCPDSQHGNLRLVHRQGDNYGALQVCDSEYGWRYFITWDWTGKAARLACRELRLPYLDPITNTLELTESVYIRKMENDYCVETAQRLNDCVDIYSREYNIVVTVNCSDGDPREEPSTLPCTAMPRECPTLPTTSSTINITTTPTGSGKEGNTLTNSRTTNTLGALLGLLGVTLAAVLVGWIMTCVYCHRRINKQTKDHTHPDSRSDPALQLNNPVYGASVPPPHTTYSSLGPSYENNQGAGHSYDVITRPHPPTTLTVPPEHEYGVLEGPAHTPGGGVVEGTYSLVGESDPQDYEIPTPTTEGGQDYSKLQH